MEMVLGVCAARGAVQSTSATRKKLAVNMVLSFLAFIERVPWDGFWVHCRPMPVNRRADKRGAKLPYSQNMALLAASCHRKVKAKSPSCLQVFTENSRRV